MPTRTTNWRRFPARSAPTEGTLPVTPSAIVAAAIDTPSVGQVEITYTNNDDRPVDFYRSIGGRTGTRKVDAGQSIVQAYTHDSATESLEIRTVDASGEVLESYVNP